MQSSNDDLDRFDIVAIIINSQTIQINMNTKDKSNIAIEILSHDPNNVLALMHLGQHFYQLHDFDTAIKYYTKALVIQTNNIIIYQRLIDCYIRIHKLEIALQFIYIARQIEDNDVIEKQYQFIFDSTEICDK